MKCRIDFRRHAWIAGTALLAVLAIAPAAHAQLLGLPQSYPVISFDSAGRTTYAGTLLSVDASSIDISRSDLMEFDEFGNVSWPRPITGTTLDEITGTFPGLGGFQIRALVNSAGVLVGGVDGHDLTITGRVDLTDLDPALGVLTGTAADPLLTGEVRTLGTDGTNHQLEFRFAITGGQLAGLFGAMDVGVRFTAAPRVGYDDAGFNNFAADFVGGATGAAFATEMETAPLPPPPPPPSGDPSGDLQPPPPPLVMTSGDVVVEALGPFGAPAFFSAATVPDFFGQTLAVTCAPASGSMFPLGITPVTCTSEPDMWERTGEATLFVTVQDTTPPTIIGDDIEVQATGPDGAEVPLAVTATDLVDVDVPVACSPASGSTFPIGATTASCVAVDSSGNPTAPFTLMVTVVVKPPAIREGCFVVNFREITYFRDATVITSSDADIRTFAGLTGPFDPALWPYRASGGSGYTKSRGTLFRIYGFQPAEEGGAIPDADVSFVSYVVTHDVATDGYYIDLGGPARVIVCPEQLHEFVLSGRKGNGHDRLSTLLPQSQRNVPGIMLSHNSQIVKLPTRVRAELYQLGMDPGERGVVDYIGVQLQGEGNAAFREFVDIEFIFPGDSDTDRHQHFTQGFHTALNNNFESFAGCNYVDYAPGNDAVRLGDVWGPNRSKWWSYDASAACGTREPSVNSKQRAQYDVPFNAVQLLPTVNSGSDTLRLLYGTIRALTDAEKKNGRDHKTDWEEWDRWDR